MILEAGGRAGRGRSGRGVAGGLRVGAQGRGLSESKGSRVWGGVGVGAGDRAGQGAEEVWGAVGRSQAARAGGEDSRDHLGLGRNGTGTGTGTGQGWPALALEGHLPDAALETRQSGNPRPQQDPALRAEGKTHPCFRKSGALPGGGGARARLCRQEGPVSSRRPRRSRGARAG